MKILCSCLKYLDDIGVIHRDLKPQNIMMTSREPSKVIPFSYVYVVCGSNLMSIPNRFFAFFFPSLPDASIKLIDFGLSSIEPTSTELVGSPAFVAPEIAIGFMNERDLDKPYDSKARTLMSDMCLYFLPVFMGMRAAHFLVTFHNGLNLSDACFESSTGGYMELRSYSLHADVGTTAIYIPFRSVPGDRRRSR
jgi:serine/threonine protein kinase